MNTAPDRNSCHRRNPANHNCTKDAKSPGAAFKVKIHQKLLCDPAKPELALPQLRSAIKKKKAISSRQRYLAAAGRLREMSRLLLATQKHLS